MKAVLTKCFFVVFDFMRTIYRTTSFYKKKLIRIEAANVINTLKQKEYYSKIMLDVFDNDYVVHNGPFEGMKYIDNSSGSALLPKIMGSYEEPIQEWISQVIEGKHYETILDIGCAEGYYAVGFGMRMPESRIIAYDTNAEAIKLLGELIKLNNLSNINIKHKCTHDELNFRCKKNTLIFCDIEGGERDLLDFEKVPNLRYVDLIVESHDCFIQNMTEILIDRFYNTHIIKIFSDYPFRKNKYKTPNKCSKRMFGEIADETRPPAMKFLYMESIDGKL